MSDLDVARELRAWADGKPLAQKKARVIAREFGRTALTRHARTVMDDALRQAGVLTRPSLLDCGREAVVQLIVDGREEWRRTHWRLLAGPESAMQFEVDKRRTYGGWTADRGGRAREGDFVVLYATGRIQSYVAIGRLCCDPVQNDKVYRIKSKRDWWTYVQWQPLARSVPRAAIESQPFAKVDRSGMKQPSGASSNRLNDGIAAEAFDFLVADDPRAANTLTSWRDGRGKWPANLDPDALREADWYRPETRSPEELKLSRKIAANLVKSRRFRYITPDDEISKRAPRETQDDGLSLEHRIQDDAGFGRVDILLIDTTRPNTMLAVEVKLRATLAPSREPVAQVIRYAHALKATHGSHWQIRSLVVAEHFDEAVLALAHEHGVEARTCSRQRGVLRGAFA